MKLPDKILSKINEYYNSCIVKYHYHLKAAELYKTLYIYTTAPIIVFSSITTVLASYNGTNISQELAIAVAVFSGMTTVGQALISFIEFNTKYTQHFAISNKFMDLARMIECEISVNYFNTINDPDNNEEDKAYVKNLFEKINTELATIQDTEPYLPMVLSYADYTLLLANASKDIGILIPDELTPLIAPVLISNTILPIATTPIIHTVETA